MSVSTPEDCLGASSTSPWTSRQPGSPMSSRYPPRVNSNSTASSAVGCFSAVRLTAMAKLSRYLRRLTRFNHMDFELASWQMVYLFARPQQVYRNFMYRKRTKDQWARDDPAFLVLLAVTLLFCSILFTVTQGLTFVQFLKFAAWIVFVDCIGVGLFVATALWAFSNAFLLRPNAPPQDNVEWGYCFDVHLNACFPYIVLLHVIMPLLYPPIISFSGFFPTLIGNTLWLAAACYYVYITFLGYAAMKTLRYTHLFLYPFTFLFIFYVATVTFGWNMSQSLMYFYRTRVEGM